MILFGMLVVWGGYGLGTWGWILVKGYDVSFAQWFNPAHPFEWPKPPAVPPAIPADQIFPGSQISSAAAAAKGYTFDPLGLAGGWSFGSDGFPVPHSNKSSKTPCPKGWYFLKSSNQCWPTPVTG